MNLGLCNTNSAAPRSPLHSPSTRNGLLARLFACLGLTAAFLLLLGQPMQAAAATVTLAWDPSPDSTVVGYNLYYGLSSGSYSTVISTGTNTSVTVSNLTAGVTYYFAVTSVDVNGLESAFSPEIAYTPPATGAAPSLQITALPSGGVILTASGPSGQAYDLLASRNGGTWQVIGTGTLSTNGSFQFTDSFGTNAASCLYRLRGK